MRRHLLLALIFQCALVLCSIPTLSPVFAVAQDLDDVVIHGRLVPPFFKKFDVALDVLSELLVVGQFEILNQHLSAL